MTKVFIDLEEQQSKISFHSKASIKIAGLSVLNRIIVQQEISLMPQTRLLPITVTERVSTFGPIKVTAKKLLFIPHKMSRMKHVLLLIQYLII